MNEKTTQILDLVKGLTILELADLVKALEEEFGVSAAPVAVAAAPGAAPSLLFWSTYEPTGAIVSE